MQPCAASYDASYYQETGNNYRGRLEFRLANLWRALLICAWLRPATALDVGGGMGLLVEALRGLGCSAFGLELSLYAIAQAPPAIRRSFCQADALALPFADGTFDLAASVNVLEHIPAPRLPLVLKECARVARRGLYLEVTTLEDRGAIHRDPTHCTKISASGWAQLLSQALPDWRIWQPFRLPRFKNGVFVCRP
jgi:SAM-dependent methyltransferase